MSVHFISGKPGGGKSLWATKRIVDELVNGKRVVVTNLALKLPELNAYLQTTFPRASVNLVERVRLLSTEEVFEFWLRRGGRFVVQGDVCVWEWVDLTSEVTDRGAVRIDFGPARGLPSVLYVIDEIHEFFNAREWAKTGKGALHYLSQHRKLGDEVVCITQSVGNVDKQFRSVSQDFTYLRNHKNERFLGVFQAPGFFTWKTYQQPVTGAPGEAASAYGTFKLDVEGLASCYDTAVGVGIAGTMADMGQRRSGVPSWVLLVLIVLGLAGMWVGPEAALKAFFGGKRSSEVASATNAVPALRPGPLPGQYLAPPVTNGVIREAVAVPAGGVGASATGQGVSAGGAARPGATVARPVYLEGVATIGPKAFVFLSDGRTYTSDDRALTFVGPRVAIVDGIAYEPAPRAPALPRSQVTSGMFGTVTP